MLNLFSIYMYNSRHKHKKHRREAISRSRSPLSDVSDLSNTPHRVDGKCFLIL